MKKGSKKTKKISENKNHSSELITDLKAIWSKLEERASDDEVIERFAQYFEERLYNERNIEEVSDLKLPSKDDLEILKIFEPKTPFDPGSRAPKKPFKRQRAMDAMLDRGLRLYNHGELKGAIDCFQIILDSEPSTETEDKEFRKKLEQLKEYMEIQHELGTEHPAFSELNPDLQMDPEEELAKMMGTSSYMKIDRSSASIDEMLPNPVMAEKIIHEMIEKGYFPNDYFNVGNSQLDNKTDDEDIEDLGTNYMVNDDKSKDHSLGGIIQEITKRLEVEEKLKVLSSAVEQVSEGITVSSLDGKLVYANPAFADMHGYDPDKVIGESIANFYSSEERSFLNTAATSCSGDPQNPNSIALNGEFWHVKNDGTKFPTITKNSVLCDDSGKPIGLIGTHADITKLKRSEIELRKLGVAVEQSIDGVAVTDLEMRFTYVNDTFAAIHGYTPKEMIGMRMEELHNKSQLRGLKNKMDQFEQTGLWKGEIKRIRKDRSKFPSYMSLTLIKDPYGKPMGTLAITRDITERKRMEAELKRYTKHLEEEVHQRTNELIQSEKMASLGQLVDGVAHELNNPLEYITLNTELIQERLVDLEQYSKNEEAQTIVNEIYSLLKTNLKGIDRIASTSKALTRFAEPEKRDKHLINVNQGLKDTLQFFYNQNRHRITVHENYDSVPDIIGNLGQLNQVFMGLFLNSSQAMDQGDIWVRTRTKNSSICIEIEDNGSGIPSRVMDKIFDPFFTTKKGATGLGLSLAYRIIKAHNGEITVENKLKNGKKKGNGTKVTINLPLVETYEN